MIARITRAYVRRYSDSGQVKAYVEWQDVRGRSGRTEGEFPVGTHMAALFTRAEKEGVAIEKENW